MIRIGPAGWSYKDWAGIVYPRPLPRGFRPIAFLSQWFDTLEINTSFYGPPKADTTRAWAEDAASNRRFQFTAKLWRGFTHEMNATGEDERLFRAGMAPLLEGKLLGAVLMQFPMSFRNSPENREYIAGLQRRFDEYPLVLEVRHSSWNEAGILEMLAELGIGFCNIDQPLLGKALRPSAQRTSPVGYVRLHGRNYRNWFAENQKPGDRYDYLYSMKELEPWADRVRAISEKRRESVFVVTNNHFEGKAVANAMELISLLTGRKLPKPPDHLVLRYPALRELASDEES